MPRRSDSDNPHAVDSGMDSLFDCAPWEGEASISSEEHQQQPSEPEQLELFDDLYLPQIKIRRSPAEIQSEEELRKIMHRPRHPEEIKRQALSLFNKGYGYKRTSVILQIPQSTVRDWNRLYKQNLFLQKDSARAGSLFRKQQNASPAEEAKGGEEKVKEK